MAEERLDLVKDVFNKAEYIKTINTSFNELGTTSTTEDQIIQPTVEEFFGLYNSLFYDIPALGETNSHEYLIKTSGDYINFDEINAEIEALQAEIAQLRTDLLSAQMANVRSQIEDSASNEALEVLENEIRTANENIIQTSTTLSNNTSTSLNTPSPSRGGSSGAASGGSSMSGNSGGGGSTGGSSGGGY